jgi:DNA-binding NarL/FixJ family response regulator
LLTKKKRRLIAEQKRMKQRHQKVRPWDHVKRREVKRGRQFTFSLFARGLTDQQIAKQTGMSVAGVRLYRVVRYDYWKQRLAESRRDRGGRT